MEHTKLTNKRKIQSAPELIYLQEHKKLGRKNSVGRFLNRINSTRKFQLSRIDENRKSLLKRTFSDSKINIISDCRKNQLTSQMIAKYLLENINELNTISKKGKIVSIDINLSKAIYNLYNGNDHSEVKQAQKELAKIISDYSRNSFNRQQSNNKKFMVMNNKKNHEHPLEHIYTAYHFANGLQDLKDVDKLDDYVELLHFMLKCKEEEFELKF